MNKIILKTILLFSVAQTVSFPDLECKLVQTLEMENYNKKDRTTKNLIDIVTNPNAFQEDRRDAATDLYTRGEKTAAVEALLSFIKHDSTNDSKNVLNTYSSHWSKTSSTTITDPTSPKLAAAKTLQELEETEAAVEAFLCLAKDTNNVFLLRCSAAEELTLMNQKEEAKKAYIAIANHTLESEPTTEAIKNATEASIRDYLSILENINDKLATQIQIESAKALRALGARNKAKNVLLQLSKKSDLTPALLFSTAQSLKEIGFTKKAKELFLQLSKKSDLTTTFLFSTAQSLQELGETKEAIRLASEILTSEDAYSWDIEKAQKYLAELQATEEETTIA